MWSSIGSAAVLVAAGVLAGAIGAAGGITSLVSYPALLAVGVPALAANVANLVALVACWPGSALTSRRELSGSRPWLARGLPSAAAGGAFGAALLVSTPAAAFARVVPFLVAAGALTLLAQPALTARRERRHRDGRLLALTWVALLSVYGGYFGAGSGVMILAVTLILVDQRMPQANAVKNMLVGAGVVAAALVLVLAGPVDWSAAAPLAAGLFVGSAAGPLITRNVPAAPLRWIVSALGLILAVELWIHPR
ncbi:MAG TPA: sulfite exporter TauE/SafE family protein [Jatrophihabitans sp.]|nr:sulfite exporter TauE/SafE family protein [Jatrophihabitans sp.]